MGLRKRFRLAIGRSRDTPDEPNPPTSSHTPRASPSLRLPSEATNEPQGDQGPTAGPNRSSENPPVTEPKARLDAWNRAYDDLQKSDPKLVGEYERLLAQEFGTGGSVDQNSTSLGANDDHANHKHRRLQMENIAQTALDRTEKEARGINRAEEVMGVVDLARDLGAPVIQTFPQTALPWAGVCAALQLFKNPITESKAQRDGMIHVITRMKWYCELENQLSRKIEDGRETDSGLLSLLEDKIVTLYTALLTFLMRSVCSYFKNRILAGLRNALKLDQWEDSLKEIKSSEEDIYRDVEYQNLTEVNSNLKEILAFAKEKESQFFENILTVMQAQLTLQLSQLDQQCLKDVLLQDPRIAKEEIEDVKGGLFEESCEWVFENDDFRKWHEQDESRALWIHGDPGKGKTMLLCGIINSIQHRLPRTDTLSYFFCQADQPKSNTFAGVLRGIIYDLARKHPDLISHIREIYDVKGSKLFTDTGSWADLSNILTQMVSALDRGTTYLMIDALDECQEDRDRLMKFIINQASEQPKLRWIVTSRNWSSIGSVFEKKQTVRSLSLENNADLISLAVRGYINYQIDSLAHEKGYDDNFRSKVKTHLLSKAEETHLWVALVCKALRDTEGDSFWAEEALNEFPSGLDDLYGKMMDQVTQGKQAELCRQVLSCLALVHRPITLLELVVCIDLTPTLRSKALSEERLAGVLRPIVNFCGSFLKIRSDTVYFVHQSAKEYLNGPHAQAVFPEGVSHVHRGIFHRSITSLTKGLHRDMYHLETPRSLDTFGIHIDDVKRPLNNPLSALSYSCVYWVDHLEAYVAENDDQASILVDGGELHIFLEKCFIYWLEALSLLRAIEEGITAAGKLLQIVRSIEVADETKACDLLNYVQDARHFLLYHASIITRFPLQTYASALVFSPKQSLVRKSFERDLPAWFNCAFGIKEDWDVACHVFQPDEFNPSAIALSPNEGYIAVVSDRRDNCKIEIYERATSRHLQSIDTGFDGHLNILAFSHDAGFIAYGSRDMKQASIVDIRTGHCLQTVRFNFQYVHAIFFSGDDKKIVMHGGTPGSGMTPGLSFVWDVHSNELVERTDLGYVIAYNAKRDVCLVEEASSYTVRNVAAGDVIARFHLASQPVQKATFSPDGEIVAVWAESIQILESCSGKLIRTVPTPDIRPSSHRAFCISNDNRLLAHELEDAMVVTDIATGMCLQASQAGFTDSLSFINNAQQLFAAPRLSGQGIRTWDVTQSTSKIREQAGIQTPDWIYIPPNADCVVGCTGRRVEVFDLHKTSRHTMTTALGQHCYTTDGKTLFFWDNDGQIEAFNIKTGECFQTIRTQCEIKVCFASSDGRYIATVAEKTLGSLFVIAVWRVLSGECVHEFQFFANEKYSPDQPCISFSPDNSHVVCLHAEALQSWDVSTGESKFRIDDPENTVEDVVFFNHRKSILVFGRSSATIRSLLTGQLETTINPPPTELRSIRGIISEDDKLMAWHLYDEIWVWDMETETFRGAFVFYTSNNSTVRLVTCIHGRALRTEFGDIVLEDTDDRESPVLEAEPATFARLGYEDHYHEGHYDPWIGWKGARLLTIPEDYHAFGRHTNYGVLVREQVVAIRSNSGMVVLKFNIE